MEPPTRVMRSGGREPGWLGVALGVACGLLAGVLIAFAIGAAGGGTTRTVTRAVAPTTSTGGTVVTETDVPDVIGARLDIAKQRMRRAGFDVNVHGGGTFGIVREQNWHVVATDPPGGNRRERGSAVTLDVER